MVMGEARVLSAGPGYAAGALLINPPAIAALPSLGGVAVKGVPADIVVLPLALTRLPSKVPDLEVVASLLVLGLICTALAYLIFFALVAEVGASRGRVITYVNPAVSVLPGSTSLVEPPNPPTIVWFRLTY